MRAQGKGRRSRTRFGELQGGSAITIFLALSAVSAVFAPACAPQPYTRLNAPPQGAGDERPVWGDMYTYHDDQGILADMSIADIHFVPHSAELSGVGQARLERYAELLAGRGGTLHYDTAIGDEELVKDRLTGAERFLAEVVAGRKEVRVVLGPAGGRGMDHKEALAGEAVAKQPEGRQTAYRLSEYAGSEGNK